MFAHLYGQKLSIRDSTAVTASLNNENFFRFKESLRLCLSSLHFYFSVLPFLAFLNTFFELSLSLLCRSELVTRVSLGCVVLDIFGRLETHLVNGEADGKED
jgi:hypothetical protein